MISNRIVFIVSLRCNLLRCIVLYCNVLHCFEMSCIVLLYCVAGMNRVPLRCVSLRRVVVNYVMS